MRRGAAAILAIVVCGLALAAAPAVARVRDCGWYGDHGDGDLRWGPPPVYGVALHVTARSVSCRWARRFVGRRDAGRPHRYPPPQRWRTHSGWRCRVVAEGEEYEKGRCVKRRRVIKWTGSS